MVPLLLATLLTLAPEAPPDAVRPPPELYSDASTGAVHHFAATFAGALLGALPGAAALGVGYHLARGPGAAPVAVTGLGLALLPVGVGLGATMGHVLSGARGSLGTALISAGVATVVSSFALAFHSFSTDHPSWAGQQRVRMWAPAGAIALAAPVLTATIALQVHHHRAFQVAATPMRGGGAVAVSAVF